MSIRNISLFTRACVFFIFISCGDEGEKSLVDPSGNSTAAQSPALPIMLPSTNNAATITPQQPTQQVTASSPALNPPHGQPGHRCDISVGAPLPGAASVNINPQPTVAASTPVVNNKIATPKLNPAHGQPGHRCDISVGAPLPQTGSQPVQSAVANNNTITQNPVPAVSLPAGNTNIKLNPAHGQPGHRCDIAVGAPLK